ncbi:CobW family GTP-binding protein [Paenibacillus taiwanensis]|uniref:CobW family GTP-binding protein n=1 Tax=Paenibacillus taiwanensis TaxID=401638 RepID=UPI0004237359|nr:GTP-binding protein [Paenibacillus taiwanensis]
MISSISAENAVRQDIPVIILSGFLGSGKTTLLQQLVAWSLEAGLTPAVIMNEVGDVNLDGQLLPEQVPMEELLSGCICCSIRGDFGIKLHELVTQQAPDVIYVECTGIAEPMELVDTLTEVSLYAPVQLTQIVTLADTVQLADQVFLAPDAMQTPSKKLERLLREQVRAANVLVLNKCDLLSEAEADRVEGQLRAWNDTAVRIRTSKAIVPRSVWEHSLLTSQQLSDNLVAAQVPQELAGEHSSCTCGMHMDNDEQHAEARGDAGSEQQCLIHRSRPSAHAHVTVWTHPIEKPLNSERFEQWLMDLPQEVYRAKGIVSFTDTSKRYMFQYAYRATEFIPIMPQGQVDDVIVLIGEQMNADELYKRLSACMDNA